MEKKLQDFIKQIGVISDIRNIFRMNAVQFNLEHPIVPTGEGLGEAPIHFLLIASVLEPVHSLSLELPINCIWFCYDDTSSMYLKGYKRIAKAPANELNSTWLELTSYDEIFETPQYYEFDISQKGPRGIKGDKGDKGDVGPIGPQGEVGPIGNTGLRGTQGLIGEIGPKGDKGDRGLQGLKGDQGEVGPVGPQGSVGPIGLQGDQGLIGLTGAQGPKGDTGLTGAASTVAGPQGDKGLMGLTGSPGAPGLTGPLGPQGIQGMQGSTGPIGNAGPQGNAGPTYPLYHGYVSVDIASRSSNTQFYFDFTAWFNDFKARFPNANASDFMVIPYPIPSSTIVGNPTPLIEAAGQNSMGDYSFVKFVTSAPDYLGGVKYKFHLSLGARGLSAAGADHSYSTGVAMSYTIQFIGGADIQSLLAMSTAGTTTQTV